MKVLQLYHQSFSYNQFGLVSKELYILKTFVFRKNIATLLVICVNNLLNYDGNTCKPDFIGIMMKLSTSIIFKNI